MPVPLRAATLALLAACTLALSACGGDDSYGDDVPRSTPELTPPAGADALAGTDGANGASTTSTDETTTDETPSASSGTGTATTPAPATTQPAAPSGAGTGGAATPTTPAAPAQPEQDAGAGTGGASPGEFSQFCQDNPGACPGN